MFKVDGKFGKYRSAGELTKAAVFDVTGLSRLIPKIDFLAHELRVDPSPKETVLVGMVWRKVVGDDPTAGRLKRVNKAASLIDG